MPKKAILIDFYGTLVYEDDNAVAKICDEISASGNGFEDKSEIPSYWWQRFNALFAGAYGDSFKSQRELLHISLELTVQHFNSTANSKNLCKLMFKHWLKPPIFDETKEFMIKAGLPICIVSNSDRKDIENAINYHRLQPNRIITSEDAKSYKPRSEMFDLALEKLGLDANEVVHIGDSITRDVIGAHQSGIDVIWLNRHRKPISSYMDPTMVCDNLLSALNMDIFAD